MTLRVTSRKPRACGERSGGRQLTMRSPRRKTVAQSVWPACWRDHRRSAWPLCERWRRSPQTGRGFRCSVRARVALNGTGTDCEHVSVNEGRTALVLTLDGDGDRSCCGAALRCPRLFERDGRAAEDVPALNRVWIGDITYIATGEGWRYRAVVLDLRSRRVIGWAMRHTMDGAITRDAHVRPSSTTSKGGTIGNIGIRVWAISFRSPANCSRLGCRNCRRKHKPGVH